MNVVAGQQSMSVVADTTMYVFLNPTIDINIALRSLLVLIVSGLLAGFIPARKAVSVKPVIALNAR
jgi:putative ABC transport system permease protein